MTPFLSADNTYISDEIQLIKNEKSSLRIRSKQNTSLNMNFNLISAGGGVESTPLQVFPSPSPQKSTDRLQTFWLLLFTIKT